MGSYHGKLDEFLDLQDTLLDVRLRANFSDHPVVHLVELVNEVVDVGGVLALDPVDVVDELEGIDATEELMIIEGRDPGEFVRFQLKEGGVRDAQLGRCSDLVLGAPLSQEEAPVQRNLADQGNFVKFNDSDSWRKEPQWSVDQKRKNRREKKKLKRKSNLRRT